MRSGLILLCVLTSLNLFSQKELNGIESNLSFYGDVMVSALEAGNRSFASDQFYSLFTEYLDSVNVYETDLSFLRTLSVLEPEDARFKLVSWQIEKASYVFDYKCFIIFPDGEHVEMIDKRGVDNSLQYLNLGPDQWYGALYYNIKKIDDSNYLVFGYNGHGQYDHVKIADIIVLDDKAIQLGSEVFEDKTDPGTYQMRLSLKYSSDASVNLNYNPGLKMIVMDHLIAKMGKQAGQGPTMFPDGSYEGYELVEGKWKYIEKLYKHSYGENNAPRPKPVLDKKKDIFGQ